MSTRSSKCKACGVRTTASAGYCQRCKSLRHRGYRRIRDDQLILDEAGGAWWIWDPRGEVLVAGKPTKDAAVIALATGATDEDADDLEADPKSAAQLDREIAEFLGAKEP
jgi:hypothetical protein